MDSQFERFKKRIQKEHLIKSIFLGLSISAIIVCLLFVILKRSAQDLPFYVYLLAFIVLSPLCVFLIYKKFMPSDDKIAKRLDQTFALKEKVQTMIRYQGQDNMILKAQKEDANQELEKIPSKNLKFQISAVCYALLVMALVAVPSSILVPLKGKQNQQNPGTSSIPSITDSSTTPNSGQGSGLGSQPGSGTSTSPTSGSGEQDISEEMINLHELIDQSNAEEGLKQELHEILYTLEEEIKNAQTEQIAAEAIQNAIQKIDQAVNAYNSKEEIGDALLQEESSYLQQLGTAIKSGDATNITSSIDQLKEYLLSLSKEECVQNLQSLATQILDALVKSGVSSSDELYQALATLAESFQQIAANLQNSSITLTEAQTQIQQALELAKQQTLQDVAIQMENAALGEALKEALQQMIQPKDDDPSDPDEEKPDDQKPGGDGETIYGSNDQVFTENGYSEYGEVIDEYHDKIIDTTSDGNTPEDITNILDEYFAKLYN